MLVNGVGGVDRRSWRGGAFENATKRREEEEKWKPGNKTRGRKRAAVGGGGQHPEPALPLRRVTETQNKNVGGGAVNRANE